MLLARLEERLPEALDYALLQGLLKFNVQGGLAHAPFALLPCPVHPVLNARMAALTAPFNRLALAISRDRDFLHQALAPAARGDPFTARLLSMARAADNAQPLRLLVTRNDYFLHQPNPDSPPVIRQVELNIIAASYPGLSELVNRLHRHLLRGEEAGERLVPNDPLGQVADAFAGAVARYGHAGAVVLMVVQPGEANRFDQRLLEFALAERGLRVRRVTLEEIAQQGSLRGGHLRIDGEIAAITYFRAAYGPEDFVSEEAFTGRALIEASATVSVPGLYEQLAGTKKIQQLLTQPDILRRFVPEAEAVALEATFAAQYDPEQEVPTGQGEQPAWRMAVAHPEGFVLKPQREGGGHNFFGEALREKLSSLSAEERSGYVLMERIVPPAHPTALVREGVALRVQAVSELGRFGVLLAEGPEVPVNTDSGYLVRSKAQGTEEGGVSAGFGFLNSLMLSTEEREVEQA